MVPVLSDLAEDRVQIAAHQVVDGQDPEDHAGEQRHQGAEREHPAIHLDVAAARQFRSSQPGDQTDGGEAREHAKQSAGAASMMLSVNSWRPRRTTVGAQAETDGHLLHAHVGADQHQIGDIHASDQQHEPHGGLQQVEHGLARAHQFVAKPDHLGAEAGIFQQLAVFRKFSPGWR